MCACQYVIWINHLFIHIGTWLLKLVLFEPKTVNTNMDRNGSVFIDLWFYYVHVFEDVAYNR